MKNVLLLALGALLFTGCMLGPSKNLPQTSLAPSYIEGNVELSSTDKLEQKWWKQFDDPLLNELIDITLSKNFDLRLAREKVKELRGSYRMESADLWPSVNAFGSATRFKMPENVLGFPTVGSPVHSIFVLGFDATWEVDFFGKIRSGKEAAYFDVLSSEENVHSVQVSVVAEVARIYTVIRAYQQRIHVLEKKIEAQQSILDLANSLGQSGLADDIQVENEMAELAQNKSLLPQLKDQYKESLYQLTFLLGQNPGEMNARFEKRCPIPLAEQKVPVGLPSDLLRRRPDIRIAERNYYAACARIGQAKADLFPSFSLTGALAGASSEIGNIFTKKAFVWLVWPSINWNIFQGWKTMANIKVQTSKQKQSLIAYEQTISSALKDVESALVAYVEENNSLQQLKLQVLSRKKVCSLNHVLLEVGLKEKKEFFLSQRQFLDAQDSYLQSKQKTMANLIALYKALGGGWEEMQDAPSILE